MNGPRTFLFTCLLIFVTAIFASASDIYIAQNAAGGNNGADCSDAFALTWFNNSANWGSKTTQIGPGTTVHLCGTFNAPAGSNNYLTFQSSGNSAGQITLLFENGSVLTAPYWSGPAINLNNESYITVDGGTNGTIQATANGSALANQQDNGVCVRNADSSSVNSTNLTVQNLTCANLYVDSSQADNGGQDTFGIDIFNGSNLTIQNNTVHDVKWAIRTGWYNGGYPYSNISVNGNNIYNMDHGWFGSDAEPTGAAIVSDIYVYANTVGSMVNWDNSQDLNHHDWFHLNATSSTSKISSVYLYNNYGSGDPGAYAGTGFFSFPNYSGTESNIYVFNNVFANTSTNHPWADGFYAQYGVGTSLLANNTFVSDVSGSNKDNGLHWGPAGNAVGGSGLTSENNILQVTANEAMYLDSTSSITMSDYNDYYLSPSWYWKGNWIASISSWQNSCSCDSHAKTSNTQLTATYHLSGNTSSAWQSGVSLHSICVGQPNPGLGALCSDATGVQRQSTGNWDIGAYEDSAAGNAPAAPTGLTAQVQ